MRSNPEWAILRYPRFARYLYGDISVARVMYPPVIFLPDALYWRVKEKGEDDPDAWAVIIHERAHLHRISKTFPILGPLIFGLRFLVADKKFTLSEELYAIGEEMKYRKERGIPYDIERKARHFSGPLYRNLLSYEEAKRILTEEWQGTA